MKQRRINATPKRALPPIAALALTALVILTTLPQAGTAAPRLEARLNAFSCDDVTEIPQVECEALVAFYNSTDGANWSNNSGWLDTDTPCSWYRVTCSAGHVTELDLYNNQLSGSIPTELGNLTNLQDLWLWDNQLSGSIPPELGSLTNLQDLLLGDNQLNGSIPPELSNLTNLQDLRLYTNQLSGNIPPELGNLTNLQVLWVGDNQLSGIIPPQLGNLTSLWTLGLSSNQLSGNIPAELGNLTNLQVLWVGDNQLSGIISPELSNLTNLQSLHLYTNQLSGIIPPALGNLTNLQILWLSGNQLSGSIPPELGNLASLLLLSLHNNQLSGALPGTLTNLVNLDTFHFDNTDLCEPPDAAFQAWLDGISDLESTGVICPGPPYTVTVTAYPTFIPVGGFTSTLTATVKDMYDNMVADGTVVTFTTSLGAVGSAAVTKTTSSGVATAVLASGAVAGTAIITATCDSVTDTTQVTFTPGPPCVVTLAAHPTTLTVGETSTLTATVTDQYYNCVADGTVVTFTTSLGTLGSTTVTKITVSGIATADLTSQAVGTAVVTATPGSIYDTANVIFYPGPPSTVTLEANPTSISVGGSASTLTATVTDQFNNNVADGTVVHFETSLGSLGSTTVDKTTVSGVATAILTSGDTAGTAVITATSDSVIATTQVTFTAGSGYAVIVAGQADWRLKWAMDHSANNAYRALRNLGFDDDHIFYLNSERPQDIDDNGDDEVDADALLTQFENAVNEVKDKIGGQPTPFIVHIAGHGQRDPDCFIFDGDDPLEGYLWVPDFADMLSDFSNQTPMLIVVGSCYSGNFITSDEGISALNRIIITATHDDQQRWSLLGLGGWFHSSDRFWGNLNKGLNVKEAFITNTWPGEWWHLWLDDNGDAIGHPPNNLGNDGEIAAATQIGVPGTENLRLTPWISIAKLSPGELRVYDSENRVTGSVNGEVKEEIPNSVYNEQDDTVAIFSPTYAYRYQVVGTGEGVYGLELGSVEGGDATAFTAIDIPTSVNATHQYTVDWDALSQSDEGVIVQVDSDGDGEFEHDFMADSELTRDEFLAGTTPPIPVGGIIVPVNRFELLGPWIILVALAAVGAIGTALLSRHMA